MKNVNYIMCGASAHDTAHDATHDTSVISKQNLLLEFCADPKSRDEMQAYIDVSSRSHFSKYYLKPLLSSGKLEMMFPDKPKSKNQKLMLSRLVDTFFSRTSWTMLLYAENHSISVA